MTVLVSSTRTKDDLALQIQELSFELNQLRNDKEKTLRRIAENEEFLSSRETRSKELVESFQNKVVKLKEQKENLIEKTKELDSVLFSKNKEHRNKVKDLESAEKTIEKKNKLLISLKSQFEESQSYFLKILEQSSGSVKELNSRASVLRDTVSKEEKKLNDFQKEMIELENNLGQREQKLNERSIQLSHQEKDGRIYLSRIKKELERLKKL